MGVDGVGLIPTAYRGGAGLIPSPPCLSYRRPLMQFAYRVIRLSCARPATAKPYAALPDGSLLTNRSDTVKPSNW
jgi:hypothetical protein